MKVSERKIALHPIQVWAMMIFLAIMVLLEVSAWAIGSLQLFICTYLIAGFLAFGLYNKLYAFRKWTLAHTGTLTVFVIFGLFSFFICSRLALKELRNT